MIKVGLASCWDCPTDNHLLAIARVRALPEGSIFNRWALELSYTTGNVVTDLLHNFHLECGARLHKLRVYETLTDQTGREVCGYLLVRGSVHAHAYALALKQITGVEIEKMLPTPNINLDKIPECQKYLQEGSHRRLYTFSPNDYKEMPSAFTPDNAPEEMFEIASKLYKKSR